MNPKIAVFINPFVKSPKSIAIQDMVRKFYESKGTAFTVYGLKYPSFDELSQFSLCVVVGGDGTLNFFLNAFPEIQIPLSIITAGTGNDFAHKLYGLKNIQQQLEISINGDLKAIDIGICNGRLFHNGVGVGFAGNVVFNMLKRKFFSGILAYYAQVIPLVFSYRENEVSMIINGMESKKDALMATIANGSYFGGGFNIAPLANLQDGLLDLCLVTKLPVWKRILNLPLIEKGKHLGLPFVEYAQMNEISIKSERPLHAHIDGEYFFTDKFDIKLQANKLKFLS
jgi:diacylglycerol kinase (ATP)